MTPTPLEPHRAARLLMAAVVRAAYSPDQPRDEDGKWTSGGELDAPPAPGFTRLYRVEPKEFTDNSWLQKHLTPEQWQDAVNKRGRLFTDNLEKSKDYGWGASTHKSYFVDVPNAVAEAAKLQHPEGWIEYLLPQEHVKRKIRAAAGSPIHSAADARVAAFSVSLRHAFAVARKTLRSSRSVETGVSALRQALEATLPAQVAAAMAAGGRATRVPEARVASDQRELATKIISFRFDAANQQAVAWAKRHAAELIDDISEVSRKRIRAAIAGLAEGDDWNTRLDEILSAVGDVDRADLIARHETMLAASEGQRQAWDQAVEDGLLTGGERRTWIVTDDERLCPICSELDGAVADLDGEYPGGFDGPPAHVQCRCTEGLA